MQNIEIQNILISQLHNITAFLLNLTPKIIAGIFTLIIIFYFGKFFNKGITKLINKSKLPKNYLNLYLKIYKILFIFIGSVVFLNILGFQGVANGILAGGGVTTVILGFAFREIGENFFAGLLLSLSRPFKIGDLIKTSNVEGIVKSIEIRYTHIRSSDGKDIYVPSSQIYKNTLTNYTKDGLRRFDFNININYESDLQKACKIIDEELNSIKGILKDPAPGCFINNLPSGYIEIKNYLWINTDDKYSASTIIKEAVDKIKTKLIAEGFNLSHKHCC